MLLIHFFLVVISPARFDLWPEMGWTDTFTSSIEDVNYPKKGMSRKSLSHLYINYSSFFVPLIISNQIESERERKQLYIYIYID